MDLSAPALEYRPLADRMRTAAEAMPLAFPTIPTLSLPDFDPIPAPELPDRPTPAQISQALDFLGCSTSELAARAGSPTLGRMLRRARRKEGMRPDRAAWLRQIVQAGVRDTETAEWRQRAYAYEVWGALMAGAVSSRATLAQEAGQDAGAVAEWRKGANRQIEGVWLLILAERPPDERVSLWSETVDTAARRWVEYMPPKEAPAV